MKNPFLLSSLQSLHTNPNSLLISNPYMEISFVLRPKIVIEAPLLFFPPTTRLAHENLCRKKNMINVSCKTTRTTRANKSTIIRCNKKVNKNFYELLSLDFSYDQGSTSNISFDDIKKAYRKMALQYHPDICTDPLRKEESTQRFVELRRAYETLSDPILRSKYDLEIGLGGGNDLGSATTEVGGEMQSRRAGFSKEVWEDQLLGLKKRSQDRMQNMKNKKTDDTTDHE